ncbi:hypothetical protein [Paraburkholderia sp. Ac-20347]|uniref:hypothetical protein n=1 Tax=Paraburkholderia sp. Ac-20347 TaxID=2703892 RepID=UPI0019826AF0|nr:hypothetical protein [Paraburkholderia sp. Ac-20347]MBN3814672.1 hypothetical protein [Paraburkholderia sp. Ac-20347]
MNAPTIGRTHGTTPLPDTTPAHESGAPAKTQGTPQPQTEDGKLATLSALNSGAQTGGQAAAGKGKRASFAAKPATAQTGNASSTPTHTPTSAANGQHGAPVAPVQSAFGKASSLLQDAAPLVSGGAGVLGAGMQIAGGVMQAIQSAEMAIAETIKNGAHNVEEASRPV